jgi:hypothetical protein
MRNYPYRSLGYLYSHVPTPDEPVTTATVGEVILPLLETVYCVLDTFANAAQREELTNAYLGSALDVLAGHVEVTIGLLQRLEGGRRGGQGLGNSATQ